MILFSVDCSTCYVAEFDWKFKDSFGFLVQNLCDFWCIFCIFFSTFSLAGFSSAPEEASGLCGCIVGCRSLRIYNTGVGQQNIQIHTVHLPFAEHWINESGHLSFVVCKKEKKRKRKISFWAFHHSLLNLTLFFSYFLLEFISVR